MMNYNLQIMTIILQNLVKNTEQWEQTELRNFQFRVSVQNILQAGDFIIASQEENGEEISKVYDSESNEKISGKLEEVNTAKGYIRMYLDDEYKYYNFKFEEKTASSLLTSNTLFLSKKDGKYGFVDNARKC